MLLVSFKILLFFGLLYFFAHLIKRSIDSAERRTRELRKFFGGDIPPHIRRPGAGFW